jgi:RNA polymerase sigma-70 factor, ECF subfamily
LDFKSRFGAAIHFLAEFCQDFRFAACLRVSSEFGEAGGTSVISDEETIAEYVRTRDGGRLGEVFQRHVPRVRTMVFQLVLDNHLADDVTQEVFLRAWRNLDRFRGRSKFSTWLYRIAVNTARDALADRRRDSRRLQVLREDAEPASAAAGPERSVMSAELQGEIEAAMGELPTAWREAIVLTVLQELDGKTAAEIAGCSRATLYWRVHRARGFLERRLGDYLQ